MKEDNTEKHEALASRVSVVENSMKAFGEALDKVEYKLDNGLSAITVQLQRMESERHKQDRPNYMLWISACALMVSLFGGLYTLIGLRIDGAAGPIKLQLQEVETQFNANDQLRNVQFSDQQRLNAILWNASDLGKLSPYPSGPFFQPSISKQSSPNQE